MPPQRTNLTSETGRDAAGLGLDLSLALVKDAMDEASAAARPDTSIAALGGALSKRDAAGRPAASTRSVLSLLNACWGAFQERRERRRLRTCLHELGERQLMDIGIPPSDIEYITAHRAIDRLRDSLIMSRGVM